MTQDDIIKTAQSVSSCDFMFTPGARSAYKMGQNWTSDLLKQSGSDWQFHAGLNKPNVQEFSWTEPTFGVKAR